ncbi:hypothetical protein MNV49_005261 [Pseudohyphozyma bogoriensis]|nr:hypothetical protein MNV49_005261 [Pseudohyphozyma bogoriensis]
MVPHLVFALVRAVLAFAMLLASAAPFASTLVLFGPERLFVNTDSWPLDLRTQIYLLAHFGIIPILAVGCCLQPTGGFRVLVNLRPFFAIFWTIDVATTIVGCWQAGAEDKGATMVGLAAAALLLLQAALAMRVLGPLMGTCEEGSVGEGNGSMMSGQSRATVAIELLRVLGGIFGLPFAPACKESLAYYAITTHDDDDNDEKNYKIDDCLPPSYRQDHPQKLSTSPPPRPLPALLLRILMGGAFVLPTCSTALTTLDPERAPVPPNVQITILLLAHAFIVAAAGAAQYCNPPGGWPAAMQLRKWALLGWGTDADVLFVWSVPNAQGIGAGGNATIVLTS